MIYTWKISGVDRIIEKDNLKDIINTVHWRYKATNENNVSAEIYGAITLKEPNLENFKPFDQITELDVSNWLENIFSVEFVNDDDVEQLTKLEQMQNILIQKIELQENPQTITSTLNA